MPPSAGSVAQFKFTPVLGAKIFGSVVMSVLGMYYLNRGNKERDFGAMVKGALLVLLSLFLFA